MECELCGRRAMMFCESDRASLCCACDEKVHGANFLVAKHHRNLLCYACQSPTPWTASGPKLTPTVSVCEGCVHSHRRKCDRGPDRESQGGNDVDDDGVYEVIESEGESEVEEDNDHEDEDEDGENQVVPWSHASSPPPPPSSPSAASSSSVAFSSGGGAKKTLKRKRETGDASDSDDDSTRRLTSEESSSPTNSPLLKHFRATIEPVHPPTNQYLKDTLELRPRGIMNSIKRLQTAMDTDCNEASRKVVLGTRNRRNRAINSESYSPPS